MNKVMSILLASSANSVLALAGDGVPEHQRPNILFCVVDDVSYGHWSCYGCDWIRTPGCDFVAENGLVFTRAYTPNAKSGPSRSCILTGLNSWQLGAAANHFAFFPQDIRTFPEILRENGYVTALTGKGWFPGEPGEIDGQPRQLIGKKYNFKRLVPPVPTISNIDYAANFELFLSKRNKDKPFFFWYGGWEAHRPYTYGSGRTEDRDLNSVDKIPEIFPDTEEVRTDLCDYAAEVEYFDSHLLRMIQSLEKEGLLDNTIIVVTSDNGMSFPRIKGQCYHDSHHLPLVIMWKGHILPGSQSDTFVSFTDFAPTLLAAAGIEYGQFAMEGNSLLPVFEDTSVNVRDYMCIGKERHDMGRSGDAGYPIRGIVKDNWIYIRNYECDRDPAGNPETGYLNYDGSPTKTLLLKRHDKYFRLSFGKRPEEELYDLSSDPDCVRNLASKPGYKPLLETLRNQMTVKLRDDRDPRMEGMGDVFDSYPYSMDKYRGYYDRIMSGDSIPIPNWISPSDVDYKELNRKIRRYNRNCR